MEVENNNTHGFNMYETMFRSYDPALWRFHQVDPLAEWTINISSYQYANNDPIYFNDPLGLTATPKLSKATWKMSNDFYDGYLNGGPDYWQTDKDSNGSGPGDD